MEQFWKFIYDLCDPITDNVYLVIILISVTAAVLLFLLQHGLSRLTKKDLYLTFGPLSMLFTYFVADMTVRLPMLHPRINKALMTVSGIITSSGSYSKNFEEASGITIEGSQTIASYLYYLTKDQQEAWNCQPRKLYESVFRVLEQTRSGWTLPDVNVPCFGELNFLFVFVILAILLAGGMLVAGSARTAMTKAQFNVHIIWFIVSSLFLIWMCTKTSGAALCATLMLIVPTILYQIVKSPIETENSEK